MNDLYSAFDIIQLYHKIQKRFLKLSIKSYYIVLFYQQKSLNMKPTRAGFYCNTGTVNIPVPSGNIKPKQKIHSTHPDFEKISQYYESYLMHETAVSPHLRGAFKDFANTTYVDKIVDGVVDAILTPLPDSIEDKVKPFAEPVKELISDAIEGLLNINPETTVSETQTLEAPPVVDDTTQPLAPEKPKKRKLQ